MSYALVQCAIAPIMKDITFDSSLEDEVLYGMKVELLSQINEEWYRIKTHYRYEGFVHSSYLLKGDSYISTWETSKRMVVVHAYADVLSQPKVQGALIIGLTRGAQVAILDKPDENGWVKVGLVDKRVGFMKEKFLGTLEKSMYEEVYRINKSEENFREELVENALKYLGTQYRWGGKTSLGIDCSGLCSISYMMAGLVIYRDANLSISIKKGFPMREIPYHEKKPGDLLFFPGHVAMYIGNGKYVHSTGKNGSDGVVINSLNPKDEDFREDLLNRLSGTGSVF